MKRIILKSLVIFAILAVLATPVLAFSAVQFFVIDSLTLQPWGTSDGQSYYIYIMGSDSGTLLDTGTLTTPAAPVLDFTCTYGSACPPGSSSTLSAPATGETVTIYITLTGTDGNPSTYITSFQQPLIDLGTFTINHQTGTGPNAIELSEFSVNSQSSANTWLPFLLLVGSVALVSGAVTVIRKRRA